MEVFDDKNIDNSEMEELVTITIVTIIMMTYRLNSMEKKKILTWLRNWSGKHAWEYFLLIKIPQCRFDKISSFEQIELILRLPINNLFRFFWQRIFKLSSHASEIPVGRVIEAFD